MFREIRGVKPGIRRRWFQTPYFDLFLTQDVLGRPEWFQLCYLRDTRHEPPPIARFVEHKVREHRRPSHRFRRPAARTPRWLERLRKRTL
jgi:hypothetical protein